MKSSAGRALCRTVRGTQVFCRNMFMYGADVEKDISDFFASTTTTRGGDGPNDSAEAQLVCNWKLCLLTVTVGPASLSHLAQLSSTKLISNNGQWSEVNRSS